jgi:hypothetical protein
VNPLDQLIADLIDSLEAWAFEREKVLTKLDIHSARHARQLATDLYTARQIALSGDPDLVERAEIRVAMLKLRAERLLAKARAEEEAAVSVQEIEVDLDDLMEPASQRPTIPFPDLVEPVRPSPRPSETRVRSAGSGSFTNRALGKTQTGNR